MKIFKFTLSALVALAITFSACSGEKRKNENRLNLRITGDPKTLIPILTSNGDELFMARQCYQSLLSFDKNEEKLVPILATALPTVTMIDTGKYKGSIKQTYEIRPEATWGDGKPVTAEDVLFTAKMIFIPNFGASAWRSSIDFVTNVEVDAQNPRKISFIYQKPFFTDIESIGTFSILPAHFFDKDNVLKKYSFADILVATANKKNITDPNIDNLVAKILAPTFAKAKEGIMGSGAFEVEKIETGKGIFLKKKQNWWGDKLAAQDSNFVMLLEGINFKIVKDDVAALAMLKEGQLDVYSKVISEEFLKLQKEKSDSFYCESFPSMVVTSALFNCRSSILSDKETRKAITHLFDKETYIKNVMRGFATIANTPILPKRPYYNKNVPSYAFNIDSAKQKLAALGWKDTDGDSILDKTINGKKTPLILRMPIVTIGQSKDIALIFQNDAKKAGVRIELTYLEQTIFKEALRKRNFDIIISSFGYQSALDDLKQNWSSAANTPDGTNYTQFDNKQADALLESIRNETNEEKRNAYYMSLQSIIADEAPAAFLLNASERLVVSKRFTVNFTKGKLGYDLGSMKLK